MVTEARETGSLIGSDKVEGTAVYGAGDTKIGSIERVMIDKISGKVSYAVLSFGGFLGPTMVGSVELLLRDDQTAVIEQLGVHPPYRKHGYARQLVREAVAAALTLPTTRSSTWGF